MLGNNSRRRIEKSGIGKRRIYISVDGREISKVVRDSIRVHIGVEAGLHVGRSLVNYCCRLDNTLWMNTLEVWIIRGIRRILLISWERELLATMEPVVMLTVGPKPLKCLPTRVGWVGELEVRKAYLWGLRMYMSLATLNQIP